MPFNSLSYNQQGIIDIQQCSVVDNQTCTTFQQYFPIKQNDFGLNKLHMLLINVFLRFNSVMGTKRTILEHSKSSKRKKTIVKTFKH